MEMRSELQEKHRRQPRVVRSDGSLAEF